MEEVDLQPLRISAGWHVEWNLFYKVNPSKKTMHYLDASALLPLSIHGVMSTINLNF